MRYGHFQQERGHIEAGLPLIIIAILGGIVVSHFWPAIPSWGRVASVIALGVFALAGLLSLGKPGGMGSGLDPRTLSGPGAPSRDRDEDNKDQ